MSDANPLIDESLQNKLESMRGAVIRLNENLFVQIIRKKLIFYVIKDESKKKNKKKKRWIKLRPISVEGNRFHFPTDVFGVYQSEDNYVYYFRKFRFCRRHLEDYNEVRH